MSIINTLYRGLKVGIGAFKQDQPMRGHYGFGTYYAISPGPASTWVGDLGIVVKYKPVRDLKLKRYADEVEWGTDVLKDLPKNYDGVFLSHLNQEAGQQVILRNPKLVKPSGYWPISGPVYSGSLAPKLLKRISGSTQEFEYGDYTLLHSMRKYNEQGTTWDEHTIKAFDSQKQEVGKYSFQQHILDGKDILIEDNVYTTPQAQKQGLATQAYLLIEKITGLKIRPNGQFRENGKWEVSRYHQSDQARNLWRSRNGKWGISDSEMVQEATALGATIIRIQAGAGSAKLVHWDYNSFYSSIADDLTESLTYEEDDYLFLEALTNGGEKGAGLKVLKRALERTRRDGKILAVVVLSKETVGQDKLRDWYLDTGLLEHVPTQRGTWFQNIFVDKQANLTLK